jgi:hypothetical protein
MPIRGGAGSRQAGNISNVTVRDVFCVITTGRNGPSIRTLEEPAILIVTNVKLTSRICDFLQPCGCRFASRAGRAPTGHSFNNRRKLSPSHFLSRQANVELLADFRVHMLGDMIRTAGAENLFDLYFRPLQDVRRPLLRPILRA